MCQLSRNFISITVLDIYRNIGNFVLSFEWDLEFNILRPFYPPLIFKSLWKGDILANVATTVIPCLWIVSRLYWPRLAKHSIFPFRDCVKSISHSSDLTFNISDSEPVVKSSTLPRERDLWQDPGLARSRSKVGSPRIDIFLPTTQIWETLMST